jgi:hypothetical protein
MVWLSSETLEFSLENRAAVLSGRLFRVDAVWTKYDRSFWEQFSIPASRLWVSAGSLAGRK